MAVGRTSRILQDGRPAPLHHANSPLPPPHERAAGLSNRPGRFAVRLHCRPHAQGPANDGGGSWSIQS